MAKGLNRQQEDAIARSLRLGLTAAQRRIVRVLDAHSDEYPDGFTIEEIVTLTGLSYRAVHTYLPVLERWTYVMVQRKHTGRIYPRGTIFSYGFDLSESE